jgi:hypothetical protein
MLPHFKIDNFRMIRLFFAILLTPARRYLPPNQMPQQNNHPNAKALHNFTAICRQKAISLRIHKKLPNLPLNLLQKTNGPVIHTNFVGAALRPDCNSSFEPITK